jgi:23S rRNA pseudouridine1911/1915/1917 synthase
LIAYLLPNFNAPLPAMPSDRTYHIRPVLEGQTLAAALRILVNGLSWADARKMVHGRRVQVNGNLVLDDARRLRSGDVVKVFEQARAPVPTSADIQVLHVDDDLIVIDKPAGVTTLRHSEEQGWDDKRKQRQPTLDELVQELLPRVWKPARPAQPPAKQERNDPPGVFRRPGGKPMKPAGRPPVPTVRAVHRLDRDTSGLMLFALSPRAEALLVGMFKQHTISRIYRAVVHGAIREPLRLESWFVRDRGDGLRGSSPAGASAPESQHAVTHVRPIEPVANGAYTLIECRLETGRTHQIRIHLAEAGHMLCGERTYLRPRPGAAAVLDRSNAPRQVLHSAEVSFTHPINGTKLGFTSPWPRDLAAWLKELQSLPGER